MVKFRETGMGGGLWTSRGFQRGTGNDIFVKQVRESPPYLFQRGTGIVKFRETWIPARMKEVRGALVIPRVSTGHRDG